jgi:hypothetical protein
VTDDEAAAVYVADLARRLVLARLMRMKDQPLPSLTAKNRIPMRIRDGEGSKPGS